MLLKNKLENLKSVLKNDNVLATLAERYCYAKDASNLDFDFKVPELVVFAETIEDVQNIVRYANLHEIPIISRGAGTNMVGSCVSSNGGIVINFSKMNKILDINTINMTARVQPGVILGDLKKEVEGLGLFYPPDPSNFKVSTVGGSIAQSSAGALAFKYGTTKDYVLSLKVVTADGNLVNFGVETSKSTIGYHLAQLMVGSEGTLGIIVEAVLKLIPKPEKKCLILAYFKDFKTSIQTVNQIISSNIRPASIDFMDKNSLITVESFANCGFKTDYESLLLIDLDGNKHEIEYQTKEVNKILNSMLAENITIYDKEHDAESLLKARRSSFAATTRLAPDVVSDDIIVPRDRISEMIESCYEISKKYDLKICLVGHIGDGNLHPQFALNLENENEYRNYTSARDEIYSKAILLNGTISAEHGIGLEKKAYLENTIGRETLEYMKSIKKVFDYKNILNPGKIFDL